jgi:hypothetical protein
VANAEAPATWNLFFLQPWSCGYDTNPQDGPAYQGMIYYDGDPNWGYEWWEYEAEQVNMPNYYNGTPGGTGYEFDCYTAGFISPASTRFAILGNLPTTLTLGSEAPLITQYGMPLLYVYDKTGNVVATETATSVDTSKATATFPFPSTLAQNGYSLALVNRTGDGVGFAPAGDNLLSIASSQTIAGNPFGVAVGAQTYSYEDRDTCDRGTSTGSSYLTFPIVSLYSKNQVLIGGDAVSVGANPTAVVAYAGRPVTTSTSDSCDEYRNTYSGATRAVVANSGGNSVTVLDTVNDVSVFNVQVGNQPVAIAVTSDGSLAYVANYKDSTITRVDLTAGTATSTVAVGGKPTSVSLTSAGVLWVGGVGFLTEINTQTMAVTATESISGKTIVALGYSDTVGQLVATTVDTSGNVYADEINPSSVTTGGTYTTLASNEVSSLGTHLDTQTQANVRSFTGTLASESIINTNQVGAPPIVVQDNWAVVTATPTGFTITDITGHQVLVSETTPSPVTAIAVDANLNVVYLAMPDSNTLLTVPLPGTGSN